MREKWLTWMNVLNVRRLYRFICILNNNSGLICRKCGNSDVSRFVYHWNSREEVAEVRCLRCGWRSRFTAQHSLYISRIAHSQIDKPEAAY